MSVKQEHRNNIRIAREAKAINDHLRQKEAMRMVRLPPQILAPVTSDIATRSQITGWMLRHVGEYENETRLVEGANCSLKLPVGCMEDETHWIWDVAFNIINKASVLA